jgi:hypothetical protein
MDCRLIQHTIHIGQGRERVEHDVALRQIEQQAAEVTKRLRTNLDALQAGLPFDVWKDANQALLDDRARLQGERERLKAEIETDRRREVEEQDIATSVADRLAKNLDADLDGQRRVLRSLIGDGRIVVRWESDDKGRTLAIVTFPRLGNLPEMTYRTDLPVAEQVWSEAEQSSEHWPEILALAEQHGLRRVLEEMLAEEMPPEWAAPGP